MVAGYKFVDNLVDSDISLFSDLGLQYMLELNHIVLCGRDSKVRLEYTPHITETRRRFYQNVQPIKRWYQKHKDESALKVAAEVYVGILSRPQLYIEGNHRTGSLIATYLLLTRGSPPFVLNVENAVAYFQPSSQIKFSDKTSFKGRLRLPKYEKAFKTFLEENINEDFLLAFHRGKCELNDVAVHITGHVFTKGDIVQNTLLCQVNPSCSHFDNQTSMIWLNN